MIIQLEDLWTFISSSHAGNFTVKDTTKHISLIWNYLESYLDGEDVLDLIIEEICILANKIRLEIHIGSISDVSLGDPDNNREMIWAECCTIIHNTKEDSAWLINILRYLVRMDETQLTLTAHEQARLLSMIPSRVQ